MQEETNSKNIVWIYEDLYENFQKSKKSKKKN
jgi:hypothetical protein